MRAFYNEIDPYCCAWLSNLMDAGHITPGAIDDRSIADLSPDDLTGYDRIHLFAGIAIWDLALNMAGWGSRRVWTMSCPCQPFSTAGKGGGFDDERHLWPAAFHLVSQCGPRTCFGEQVASKDGLAWLDLVQVDLEGAGYAVGAVDTCAAGFGAPQIRQRLYWVADANHAGLEGRVVRRGERPPQRSTWAGSVAVRGRDGKERFLEPGLEPLAPGHPSRVGRIRAYGNALNAEQAQAFIGAYLDAERLRLSQSSETAADVGQAIGAFA